MIKRVNNIAQTLKKLQFDVFDLSCLYETFRRETSLEAAKPA